MMRVETSVTGFTVWLTISAGTIGGMQSRGDMPQRRQHEFGRVLLGDRHVEQAGQRGKLRLPSQDAQPLLEQIRLQHRAAGDVQRIVRRAETRQRGAKFGRGSVRQLRHRQVQHLRAIGGDLARAAGNRHHASPRGCNTPVRVITSAVNSRSSIESTRTMPCWRHTPSNTRSSPTSAPVCACAERAVTSDRPIFSTTIGLAAAIARRAAAAKLGAWRIVSANSAIARTSG